MNPKAPTPEAKIKTHETSTPIKHVINNITAPFYKLATHIHHKLRGLRALKHEFNSINPMKYLGDITKFYEYLTLITNS
jgi:hypothetical protein